MNDREAVGVVIDGTVTGTNKRDREALIDAILAYGEAVREADARLAEDPYGDEVQALGGDEPKTVGRKIADAIRAAAIRATDQATNGRGR